VPGALRAIRGRPQEDEQPRAWLRAGQWRVWDPPGASAPGPARGGAGRGGGSVIQPDLEDAVTVAELGSELRAADRVEGAGPGPAGGAR
jgi:hypothetical protein